MIGDIGRRQEDSQQLLDRAQAQPHGAGGAGQLPLLVLVDEGAGLGCPILCGDRLRQPPVLGLAFGRRLGGGLGGDALFNLVSVLVDGLAAAPGRLGLPGHGAVLTREDGGSGEDPGANG